MVLVNKVYEIELKERCGYTVKEIAEIMGETERNVYYYISKTKEIGKKAILTNGFVKKTQKTPPAAIELARKYKADYERRFGR